MNCSFAKVVPGCSPMKYVFSDVMKVYACPNTSVYKMGIF